MTVPVSIAAVFLEKAFFLPAFLCFVELPASWCPSTNQQTRSRKAFASGSKGEIEHLHRYYDSKTVIKGRQFLQTFHLTFSYRDRESSAKYIVGRTQVVKLVGINCQKFSIEGSLARPAVSN